MNKTIIKKEFHESLFDCKGLWLIVACACVLSGLCVLVISIKEGSVLAQNDVLQYAQYAMKAAMFLTVTISMVLGSACFATEREENTMESLLLTPVRKRDLVIAKYLGMMLIGVALYIVCVPYLAAIGLGSGLTWRAIAMTFFGGILLLTCAFPAFADNADPVSVEIISPKSISANPVHHDNIIIRVTNNSDKTLSGLHCYLTVLDVGRTQTLPVDEFGSDAFQSRIIESLEPGQSVDVTIPVRIMYVGDFRFTATVADCESNQLYTCPAINVNMLAVSTMNTHLVIGAAAGVPILLAVVAFILTRAQK